jgi:ribosomal protein S18 acetylase RimI-like enzyme
LDTGLEIGAPEAGELGLFYELARRTFEDLPGWSDQRVRAVMRDDLVFVAREGSQAAGYVALRHERAQRAVVIEQLFVAPGHEQRGVGHRLLAYAEGWAISEGACALLIVAEVDNWRARRFYCDVGFVPVEPELLELVLPQLPD